MQQIRNTRQLRKALSRGHNEFQLLLQGGLQSSKTIHLLADGRFTVINHIDETVQTVSGRQLYNKRHSNIGAAMKLGGFIVAPEYDKRHDPHYQSK